MFFSFALGPVLPWLELEEGETQIKQCPKGNSLRAGGESVSVLPGAAGGGQDQGWGPGLELSPQKLAFSVTRGHC